jgi:predicted RNA-binding Zn-ribbon protein involved in translation (DUF1610 family)
MDRIENRMKKLKCPSCSREVEIESRYTTVNPTTGDKVIVKQAHGTIKGSELQCACGHYHI